MTQSDFSSKFLPIWLPLYRVESVLTNSNYIIRKVGTNFTQCVHRIRLRTVSPQYQVDDLSDINPDDFRRDPHLGRFRGEPQLFDEVIPNLLDPPPQEMPGLSEEQDTPPLTVGLTFPLPMAPAPVIPVAPLPPVGGHVVVPPDPVIPEGPVPLASPQVTPPDTSDDSSHEEAGPPKSVLNEVPLRPALNEFILRQTERAIRAKERSNQLDFGFLRPSPQPDAGSSSSSRDQPNQTTKRQNILDSCERSRLLVSTPTQSSSTSAHSNEQQPRSPQQILADQREIRSRYGFRHLKKRLSSQSNPNNVNSLVDSTVTPIFRFSSGHFLDSPNSIAHCVSSDLAMRKGLASTIACCYPALQQMRFYSPKCIPPGTLVAYYDASRNRFVYNLVTKRRFFHKPTYDTFQLSLLALKQHILRHNIKEISVPRLGSGYDRLHWPTVLALLYQVFSNINVAINIVQPPR